jgi:uncharacterized metal-binding protein YceD (DUF177 family)
MMVSPQGERVGLVVPPQDEALALVVGIAQITEKGLILQVEVVPEALHLPQEDAVISGAVRVHGRFNKVAEQIYFQGKIHGVITAPCSRCLETVHADFVVETRVVFLPSTSDMSEDESGQSSSDDIDLYFHDGLILDLRPLVREQVVLAFPVQLLCRDDCAGRTGTWSPVGVRRRRVTRALPF